MKTKRNLTSVMGIIAMACVVMGAAQMPAVKPPAELELLKALAGKWAGTQKTPEGVKQVALEYAVTSAGTTVTEKLFAGQDEEMVSMYHGDGDGIMMTHYCALGNQPRMRLKKSDDPKVLTFEFVDGTGLDPKKDAHMHGLKLTLVDKNHLTHDWSFYAGGKEQAVHRFEFARKK